MHNRILIPLEFGQPFLVWSIGMEFARKNVFCGVLRILCTSGAAVATVFNGGFNALPSAYPKDTLVIYMNAVVVTEVIVYAAIALVRAFIVDFSTSSAMALFSRILSLSFPAAHL